MNADTLLDAFGLIDDRFIVPPERTAGISWRRRLTVLAAAVLILALCAGTAMAISEGFRDFVFSIFPIETHDLPPATEEVHPTEPGLHEMDIVSIDGQVNAYYFSSGGFITVCDGGFYTCQWQDHAEPAFWAITPEGAVEVGSTRVAFDFPHGAKTFHILFDYAVLNGNLAVQVWAEGVDEDPIGNGWNVEPLGSRTDAVLLTIPVLSGGGYTHDLFLLDLETLEASALIADAPMLADAYWVTEDLRYAIIAGAAPDTHDFGYWLYDFQTGTCSAMDTLTGRDVGSVWFLNDSTIAFRANLDDGSFDLVRRHIPSGVQNMILEDVDSGEYRPIQNHRADGAHGLLFGADGTVKLIDFHTLEMLELTGLDPENLTCGESPDGSRIMLGYEDGSGFTRLGILDPETGVLKLLEREVNGGTESFRGWLDNDTLVITAHDSPDADTTFIPGDGYYVYVYQFPDSST